MEASVTRLLTSDDSHATAIVASVPVAICFAIGVAVGWWRRSSRAVCVGTTVPLFGLAAFLWISDCLYDFGEADQVFGHLGFGIVMGGTCGMIAFTLQNSYMRIAFSIIPQMLFGAGYLTALHSMQR